MNSAAVAAFAAEYTAMLAIGFSATTALMPRITPPAGSTGSAARMIRTGAMKSTSTRSSMVSSSMSAIGPKATTPAAITTPSR